MSAEPQLRTRTGGTASRHVRRRHAAVALLAAASAVVVGLFAGATGRSQAHHLTPGAATRPRPVPTPLPVAVEAGLLPWRLAAPISRSVVLPTGGSRLVVLGGLTAGVTTTGEVTSLDTATGATAAVAALPTPVHDAAAAVVGGPRLGLRRWCLEHGGNRAVLVAARGRAHDGHDICGDRCAAPASIGRSRRHHRAHGLSRRGLRRERGRHRRACHHRRSPLHRGGASPRGGPLRGSERTGRTPLCLRRAGRRWGIGRRSREHHPGGGSRRRSCHRRGTARRASERCGGGHLGGKDLRARRGQPGGPGADPGRGIDPDRRRRRGGESRRGQAGRHHRRSWRPCRRPWPAPRCCDGGRVPSHIVGDLGLRSHVPTAPSSPVTYRCLCPTPASP